MTSPDVSQNFNESVNTGSPVGFDTEAMLRHIRALADQIGHRPPTSAEEREAADYVAAQLSLMGYASVINQPFQSIARISQKVAPGFMLVCLGLLIGLRRGRIWQFTGGLVAVIGGLNLPSVWRLRPMPWEMAMPRAYSQNVIATVQPTGTRHRKIVVMAHLDTSFNRISAHPPLIPWFGAAADGTVITSVVTGLLSIADALRPARILGLVGMLFGVAAVAADEATGGTPGGNDDASGVAVSLALAQYLKAHPMKNTEVWFVFTGCEQSGTAGARALLEKYGSALSDALFINLKGVGRGELCWATQQGVGLFAGYRPRYGLIPIAERAAAARPDLAVIGKPMTFIDDLSVIMDWGFSGITIAGYERTTGHLPGLHQRDDTASHVAAEVLDRSAQFVREMIHQIDNADR